MKNQMEQPKKTEAEILEAIKMAEARNIQREQKNRETQAKLDEAVRTLRIAEENEQKRAAEAQPTVAPVVKREVASKPPEPKKETVKIVLPPKPTSAPTIKLPDLPASSTTEKPTTAPVAKQQPNPKKETVKIDLPPKPTWTTKLPDLPASSTPEKPTVAPVAPQVEAPSPALAEPAEKLPEFNYVAMNERGKETKGTIPAKNQEEAIAKIRAMDLFPTKVTEKGGKKGTKEGPQSKTKKFATKEERAFEIVRLEQVIKKAEARIEQNRKIEKELRRQLRELDDKEPENKLLQALEAKLEGISKIHFLKRRDLKKQILEEQEKWGKVIYEYKKDRENHPFKYYLLDQLAPMNFKVLFGSSREEPSMEELEEINRVMSINGEKLTFRNRIANVSPIFNDAVSLSSNGFYLRITNNKDIPRNEKNEPQLYDPRARFDTYAPNGTLLDSFSDFNSALANLEKSAEVYQREQRETFEKSRVKAV